MPYNNRASPAFAFIGTLFNLDWQFPPELPPGIVYMCGQIEKAPTTGKLHWQLFIKSVKKVRFSCIKKILGQDTLDLTPVTTTEFKARLYALKSRTRVAGPFELGWYGGQEQQDVGSRMHPLDEAYIILTANMTTTTTRTRVSMQRLWDWCYEHYARYQDRTKYCRIIDPWVNRPEDVVD